MGNVNKYLGAIHLLFSEVHKCIKLHDFHDLKFYDKVKNCFGDLFKFLISTMSNKKKVTFHCDMTNDEIFAILDFGTI